MNILSLFDGISCGHLALARAGIPVTQYYASEIDKYAIKVTQQNFPDTIQLGDVCNYSSWEVPKIDMVIGGSPCQEITYAGNREGLNGKHSSLFYKLVECLEKFNPEYFIVENVKMDKRWENEFTRLLGVQPIRINSNLFSAQNRDRLYWTNINVTHLPVKNNLVLGDIVREEDYNDTRLYQSKQHIKAFRRMDSKWSACLLNQKCKPIMASYYKRAYIHPYLECRNANSGFRMLSPEECEILQTLPVRYTGCISQSRRYQTIGNGWTVDVVAHILKFINENPVIESGWVKTNGKHKSLF